MDATNTLTRILQEKINTIDAMYHQIAELKRRIQQLEEWFSESDSESSSSESEWERERVDKLQAFLSSRCVL